jgi:hypothetical protein
MAISTETIRKITIQATAQGVDQTTASLNRLSAAQGNLATVTDIQTKRQLSVEQAYRRQSLAVDDVARSQDRIAKATKVADAALAQGLITQAEHATRIALITERYRPHNEMLDNARVKFRALAEAAGQAGGPLGGIIQQAGFLTVGSQHLSAGIIASTVAVGALVAALVKLIEIEKQAAAIANTAQLSSIGGQQLQGLIGAAGFKGIGSDVLLASMTKFNEQVDQAKAGLGSLGALFRANGVSASDTADAFFKVADLVKNARSEAEKFSIVRQAGLPAENQFVLLLSQGGDALRRQAEGVSKLTNDQLEQAQRIEERWNKVWTNVERWGKAAFVNIVAFLQIDLFDLIQNGFKAAFEKAGQRGGATFAERFDAVSGRSGLVSVKPAGAETVDPERVKALLNLEQQRIAILGQTATVQDEVRAKEIAITLARMDGVKVTDQEKRKLLEVAELQAKATRSAEVVAALGDSATAAEKYGAALDALKVKFAEGRLTQDQFVRALQNVNPTVIELKKSFEDLTQGIVLGLLQGKSASESLTNSLKAVTATAASATITNLIKGDIGAAAISASIAAGSFIASKFTGGATSEEKAAEQQTQQQIQAALQRSSSFSNRAGAAGLDTSTREGALSAFDIQAQEQRLQELKQAFPQMAQLEQALANERLAIIKKFDDEAAAAERQRLADARANLDQIQRGINEATGKGFLNQFADLFKQVDQARQDAALLGGNAPSLVETFFGVSAQKIVEDSGLVGTAFNDLIATFPQLAGVVHESTTALQAAADAQAKIIQQQIEALNQAAKGIVNYVNNLLAGPQATVSPQARLTQAQSTYNATLGLANVGNIDALNRITSDAENLRTAAQAFYGSSAGYQAIFNQITAQLLAIPAVSGSTDPVVIAIRDSITANQTVTQATTNAVSAQQTFLNAIKSSTEASNTLLAATNQLMASISAFTQSNNEVLGEIRNVNNSMAATLVQMQFQQNQFQEMNTHLINIQTNTNALTSGVLFVHNVASGGWITGGTAGKDSVPAMLMPGEYVVNAKNAQRYKPLLDAIESGGFNSPQSNVIPFPVAASDNSAAIVAELRRLYVRIDQLESRLVAAEVAGAEHVRDGVDVSSDALRGIAQEMKLPRAA